MASIAEELATIPFLGSVPPTALKAAAPLWEGLGLEPGEVLWDEGEGADGLAILAVGELRAEAGGAEVGRVLPGELLGEGAAFFPGAHRSATLRASRPSQVLVLPVGALRTLRWQTSPLYDALLEQSLRTLTRRISATNVKIAQTAVGDAAVPARTEPSALARLWRSIRPGGPSGPCPPLEPLLRRQPGLATADGEVVAAIAGGFVAEPLEEGQVLFLEGEPGFAAFLVADGRVEVLRNVRGSRAELLATLGPGSLFGVNTLIERGARTASCVAASAGWVYRMDAESYGKLRGPYRLAWRESVLGVLATQIRNANAALARASGAAPKAAAKTDGFGDLLRASGWLEGVPEAELERMEVVQLDESRRRQRRRT